MTKTLTLRAPGVLISALLLSTSGLAFAQNAGIVQPGAPGQASRTLTAEEATKLAQASYTASDVAFMQHMIVHHHQALDMAVMKFRRDGAEVDIVGMNEATETIVDKLAIHDKPGAIDKLMAH